MLRHLLPLLAVAMVLTSTAGAAHAVPVLDQSTLGPDNGSSFTLPPPPNVGNAQTFTVGIAGELTGIAFGAFDKGEVGGTLIVEIRTTAAGAPTTTVLASLSLNPSQIGDFPASAPQVGAADLTVVDLSGFDIQVSVGDVLALVLSMGLPHSNPFYGISAFLTNVYAGGALYGHGGLGFESFGGEDLPLQTFVEPLAIPEPASLALVLAAIGGVGLTARQRPKR